jgi:hypothetical protein
MNKEQQELLDEAYKSYENYCQSLDINDYDDKDTFIKGVKLNYRYSNRWGLKIEERELSLDEKEWELEKTNCINDIENDRIIYGHEWEKYIERQYDGIQSNQGIKIPTKLITITYKDKTIESYE